MVVGVIVFAIMIPIFEKALKDDVSVLIECEIDRNERVLPIIPSGGTIEDLIKE